jgi:hypothetical protein
MGKEYIREVMVLGSVPSLGRVILFDDMEDLLKWDKSGTGGDDTLEKSQTEVYNRDYALHAKTRVTNPLEDDYVVATRKLFQRPGKRYRLELSFFTDAGNSVDLYRFECEIYDGTYLHQVAVRYDAGNDKWQYFSSGAAWTDVTDGAQGLADNRWHHMLFEFDEANGEFIRIVSDSLEMDMSGISYRKSANAGAVAFDVNLRITANTAPPGEVYYDDVLVMEI